MSLTFATIPQKRLLAGITSASTEFYLTNILSFDGETDVVPADLGTQHYCCFRNDTGTIIELMEIDPTTISAGPITIVRRGLSFYGDLTTETTALKLDWPSNSIVMLGTDVPQIFQWLKEYVDNALIAGTVPAATTVGGIVAEASLAEIQAGTATKVVTNGTFKLFAPLDKLKTWIESFLASETAFGFVEEATDAEVTAGTATGSTGAKLFVTPAKLKSSGIFKFGGTGADGALAITSGATNIDLAGAQVVTKNYTSISITGTGSLTFTNPHANGTIIMLKSQGNVTLTSSTAPMINASGLGGEGGVAPQNSGAVNTNGNNGNAGTNFNYLPTNFGGGGSLASAPTGGAASAPTLTGLQNSWNTIIAKYPKIFVGAGGGSGGIYNQDSGTTNTVGQNGGRGGGSLIIECAGAWNFTTSNGISVAGISASGGNMGTGVADGGFGGGGGGSGGLFIALYNSLTANSGTISVAGGVGGVGGTVGTVNTNQAGGAGAGSATNAGGNGVSQSTRPATKTGGDGGAGLSLVALNTEFA